jgi:hypothetical protein
VAEQADMWHGFGDADRFRQKDEVLRRHCADVGRDPDQIERTWGVPGGEVEHAEQLHAAGVNHLTVSVDADGSGYDMAPVRRLVEWRDRQRG